MCVCMCEIFLHSIYILLVCSLLLDGERWKQADVPGEIQALVQKLETGIYNICTTHCKTHTRDIRTIAY